MASGNIEVVRRWLEQRSDDGADPAVAELCDADIDYYPVRKFPEARPCHGREAFQRFMVEWWEGFAVVESVIRELIPVGDESGVRLEGDVHHCFWLRHGLIFRMEDHLTVKGALQALGLSGDTLEAAGLRGPR